MSQRYTSTIPRPLDTATQDHSLRASLGDLMESLQQCRLELSQARRQLRQRDVEVAALVKQLRTARAVADRLRQRPRRRRADDRQLALALE